MLNTTETEFDQIDSLLLLAKICERNEGGTQETASVIRTFFTLADDLGLREGIQKTLAGQVSDTDDGTEALSFLEFMADNIYIT